MQRISIFGVTGSIGASALKLIDLSPERFEIDSISANQNLDTVIEIATKYNPKLVVIADEAHYLALRKALPANIDVAAGADALATAAERDVDVVLNAVVGAAGLPVSLAAARGAGRLALANKESLVCAGALLKATCAANDCTLIPVDSEHSAIFQSLLGQDRNALEKIILTASGGPFRTWNAEAIENATIKDALNHPNWDMGSRITIDSASMFNKAMEMIEAHQLFDVAPEQIEVLVHPQSIVHSAVEYIDGGLMAQMGVPDMRQAIGFAMNYPKRMPTGVERLNLAVLGRLDFHAPDEIRFPALRLARDVMAGAGCEGAAFNAAKEVALDAFFANKIGFVDMARHVENVMNADGWQAAPDGLGVILDVDARARAMMRERTGL